MKPEEARYFLNQLERLFGAVGEEVPRTAPRQPRRPQDAVCVSYKFSSPLMEQTFEVCFNTLKGRVFVIVIPPYGNVMCMKKEDQIEQVIAQVRTLLEIENGVFSRKQDKTLA